MPFLPGNCPFFCVSVPPVSRESVAINCRAKVRFPSPHALAGAVDLLPLAPHTHAAYCGHQRGETMRLVVTAFAVLCLACGGSAVAKPRGGGSGHAAHASSARPSTSSRTTRPRVKTTPSQLRSSAGAPRATIAPARHQSPLSHAQRSNAKPAASHPRTSTKAQGVQRNAEGRIARDHLQKARFERSHPCPSTGRHSGACPGYVIDHIRPLKRGGADRPENMQWQTKAAAKQKDETE